jgi:hypothetical protein
MTAADEVAKVSWPAWFYGPDGQSQIFQNEDEVPSGWEDHPSKVGGSEGSAKLSTIEDDDDRIDGLMAYTAPELVDILDQHNDDADEEIEFSKSWPKLKLAKTILENNVSYEPKSES